MSPNNASSMPEWPFEPRNGVEVKDDLDTLLDPEEINLTSDEHQELIGFSHDLFEGRYKDFRVDTDKDLEALYQSSAISEQQKFYLDYLFTADAEDQAHRLGFDSNTMNRADLKELLLDTAAVKERISSKDRKQIAADSLDWYKTWLAAQFTAGESDVFTDAEKLTVHYAPERLLDKVESLQEYRALYREARKDLSKLSHDQTSAQLLEAEKNVLDVHLSRINGLLADLYADVLDLRAQIELSAPSDKTEEWGARLKASMPLVENIFRQDEAKRKELINNLARRLDYIRNGAGINAQGKLGPVSMQLEGFTADYGAEANHTSYEGEFDAETLERMDTTRWNAEQLHVFIRDVLHEEGLLSEVESTWDEVEDRDGFAEDKLFQTVITPKKKSLGVDNSKRVVWVPENFNRNLTQQSPAGVLPLTAHEFTHVVQGIFDYEVGEQLPLAKIRGRRFITVREAGGTYQESVVQRQYFGRERPINMHYLRALEAKSEGEDKLTVIKRFYESAHKSNPQADSKDTLSLAIDRSLRLYRNTNHDSQPLDYVEQGMIIEELKHLSEEELTAFLIGTGSFNTHDAAKLKKAGILKIPENTTINPADTVMRVFTEKYLPRI